MKRVGVADKAITADQTKLKLVSVISKWQRKITESLSGLNSLADDVNKTPEMSGFVGTIALNKDSLQAALKGVSEVVANPAATEDMC